MNVGNPGYPLGCQYSKSVYAKIVFKLINNCLSYDKINNNLLQSNAVNSFFYRAAVLRRRLMAEQFIEQQRKGIIDIIIYNTYRILFTK